MAYFIVNIRDMENLCKYKYALITIHKESISSGVHVATAQWNDIRGNVHHVVLRDFYEDDIRLSIDTLYAVAEESIPPKFRNYFNKLQSEDK